MPGAASAQHLQTNATLLDDQWCVFLKEKDFLGVSRSTARRMHDAYRVSKGGGPTETRDPQVRA